MLLYVHRDHKDYSGREAQDGHLDFYTAPELFLQFQRRKSLLLSFSFFLCRVGAVPTVPYSVCVALKNVCLLPDSRLTFAVIKSSKVLFSS